MVSFIHPTNSKRYFLTHPNNTAPRYARARTFDNWDNVWQGMENAENLDPNYISTFELRHPSNEAGIPEEERGFMSFYHQGSTDPDDQDVPTGIEDWSTAGDETIKIIQNGLVMIVRNGHVYTIFGQKMR